MRDLLASYLPRSPQLYPDGVLTDEPEIIMIAELVREAALEGVRDELPHSLAVVVEEMVQREGRPEDSPLLDVRVNVFVERPSQKAIVIGKGGSRLREVGTNARQAIEALLGQRSTSTCTSRSPRTGSATPSSCSASASDPPRHRLLPVLEAAVARLGTKEATMSETAAHDHELEVLEDDQNVPPRPEEQIADAREDAPPTTDRPSRT